MSDVRQVHKPQSLCFRVERRVGNARPVEFHYLDLVEQVRRKIRTDDGLVLFTQRRGRRQVSFPLVPQVGRNIFYSLQDLLVVQSGGPAGAETVSSSSICFSMDE